jgi:hypothetical protein
MWIEILKTGTHTAKNGVVKTFTVADLDAMAQVYNPQYHEAPVAVGDTSDKGPAFGWVDKLKREGNVLYARINQAAPALKDMIQKGLKRKAVSFYPDYSLRTITFSGPVSHFAAGECGQYEFKDFNDAVYVEIYEEGGEKQMDINDPKMKAFLRLGDEVYFNLGRKEFTENDDPGERLHRKAMDILMNPSKHDRYGRPLTNAINYSTAFEMACEQNPDLAAGYIQQIEGTRDANGRAYLIRGGK